MQHSWVVCCSFSCMSATESKTRRVNASCFVRLLACLFVIASWFEFDLISPYAWHSGSTKLMFVFQLGGSKYQD